MRLRTSYAKPSAECSAIPPRNHNGPLTPCEGSSMSPMETGSACSIGLPLARSQATRRPEGQLLTWRRKVVRSPASSVRSTWFHTCPFGSQKRAPAHSDCASVSARSEEHTSELQSRRDLVCRLLLE